MIYVTHDQVEAMTLATRIAVLEGGVLQQVAPPLELFHRPANKFVATFIGSPSMNLIEGRVADGAFVAAGLSVPFPSAIPTQNATLGVRPHDLRAGAAAGAKGATRGTIEAVEPMGWESFAHVRLDAGKVVVRLEGALAASVKVGDVLPVFIDPGTAYLFDAGGVTVRTPDSAAEAAARSRA